MYTVYIHEIGHKHINVYTLNPVESNYREGPMSHSNYNITYTILYILDWYVLVCALHFLPHTKVNKVKNILLQ